MGFIIALVGQFFCQNKVGGCWRRSWLQALSCTCASTLSSCWFSGVLILTLSPWDFLCMAENLYGYVLDFYYEFFSKICIAYSITFFFVELIEDISLSGCRYLGKSSMVLLLGDEKLVYVNRKTYIVDFLPVIGRSYSYYE